MKGESGRPGSMKSTEGLALSLRSLKSSKLIKDAKLGVDDGGVARSMDRTWLETLLETWIVMWLGI
jgi:hypothetical protein